MIRHRMFAVINILGLALGICFCLIIFLVVRYEFSFDRFHPDGDRIYRVARSTAVVVQRFCGPGRAFRAHCFTRRLVGDEQVAARVCVSRWTGCPHIRSCRALRDGDRYFDRELSGFQGRQCESREEPSRR
jgi:hypothetical protein